MTMMVSAARRVSWVIVMVVWAALGFFYWVPLLARVTGFYVAEVLLAVFGKGNPASAERALETGADFWAQGFARANKIINDDRKDPPKRSIIMPTLDLYTVLAGILHTLYSVGFWMGVRYLVGRTLGW